jgi:hypothetical protein
LLLLNIDVDFVIALADSATKMKDRPGTHARAFQPPIPKTHRVAEIDLSTSAMSFPHLLEIPNHKAQKAEGEHYENPRVPQRELINHPTLRDDLQRAFATGDLHFAASLRC